MKGMKKRGKGTNEAKKKSKKCLACLLVLLFVIGTTIAPAAVAKEDGEAIINAKLEAIDDDPIINSFLYDRMLEYNEDEEDEGIEAVKIVVIKGHWWSGYKEVKTFYIVRNDKFDEDKDKIDIKNGDDYKGKDKNLWTFYPKERHTKDALDVLLNHELTVSNVIHLGIRAISVDKDNVPDIMEIIKNSPWASSYLPDWAKTSLEWFESHH